MVGDYRVAQVGICTTATTGNTTLDWQFDANNNRDSYMEDEIFNRVSDPNLYRGYTLHVLASPQLVGHVTWQGIPEGDARAVQPVTLTLKSTSGEYNFTGLTTDASGFFTVPLGTTPSGSYNWRVKGPKYLANDSSSSFSYNATSGIFTRVDMNVSYPYLPAGTCTNGCLRAGDANNDNRVNASDYNIFRASSGKGIGDPGYDARADFTNNNVVDISDFNLLRTNYGLSGAPPITPGGVAPKK